MSTSLRSETGLVAGRSAAKLAAAAHDSPGLLTLANDVDDPRQREIDVLFAAPVHLNHLLLLLVSQNRPTAVVNVTSGSAYVPQTFEPVYSACKAALNSYTATLRHALANTRCRVVELAPPAVQTSLATPAYGTPLDAFCDAILDDLVVGASTFGGYGPTADVGRQPPEELGRLFAESARRAAVQQYGNG